MTFSFSKDYYKILEIDQSATQDDIHAAYIRMSRKNHPDLGGTKEKMQLINEAYLTLKNPHIKNKYDIWYQKVNSIPKDPPHKKQQANSVLITIYTLDYNYGFITEKSAKSSIPFSIDSFLDENGNAYAYTSFRNNKKTRIFVNKQNFLKVQRMYNYTTFYCHIITEKGKIYDKELQRSKFINNCLQYIDLQNGGFLFVYYKNHKYEVVSEDAWNNLKYQHMKAANNRSRFRLQHVLMFFVIFLTAAGFVVSFFDSNTQYPQMTSSITLPPLPVSESITEQLPEEPIPPHNYCTKVFTDHPSNLTIKTEYSAVSPYYYVKICHYSTTRTVQSVFIHAGQTAEVYVPNGTYKIKWTSGEKWYGYENYFGNNYAQQADDTFTFDDTTGWTVTLYPVPNGNLNTEEIDIEEF